eukprot:914044_1
MITSSFMRVWYTMMILAFPTRFTNMIVRADNIMQNISASDGNLHADNFGLSVSVHNDNALVGAPRAVSDNNVEGGAVYVFTNMNGIWTQTAKLQPNIIGSSKQHRFGEGVSIYNNYALIGAPGYTTLQTPITGVAYIFDRKSLVIVLIFKIYLYYYQGLSQILSIKNITPTSQFERTVLTLFNFDLSVLSISPQNGICFIAGIQSGIYELLISYIWYVFVAVNVVIIGCVWRCLCIQRNISCTPYLKTGSLHIILMTAGSLLSTSFKFLTCIKFVDGKYYHFYDADIACYGYVWWVAGMVPVLILCGMLMGLWFIMYKQGASEREKESHAYWSLSKRFRHKMWYWEFVLFIRRLGIAAFTSFYALADRMSGILLGSFIIILFALQARFNPFKHQRANLIESLCLFATASIVIVLLVMKEGSIGISVYLTFLIVAPLCIVCAIIADIVYKWYTFQDASTQQQNDAYRYLKQ